MHITFVKFGEVMGLITFLGEQEAGERYPGYRIERDIFHAVFVAYIALTITVTAACYWNICAPVVYPCAKLCGNRV